MVLLAGIAGAALLTAGVAFAQMRGSDEMMPGGGMHSPMMQGHMQSHSGGMHGSMMKGQMQPHGEMESHGAAQPRGDQGPSSLAFRGVKAKMHSGMSIAFSGNADVDFVKGMIPHHQGAVDMAKIVLAFGKDPEIRELADGIIKAQEQEVALMKAWLQKNVR